MKNFNERLKELRIKKELSLLELAKATNISQNSLARWEDGEAVPRAKNFVVLVKFFCVSADYLLGRTDDYS